MPMSSKFLTESTGEEIVKIGQLFMNKVRQLSFLGHVDFGGVLLGLV